MKKRTCLHLVGLGLVVGVLLAASGCAPAETTTPEPAETPAAAPPTPTVAAPTPTAVPSAPKRGGNLRIGVKGETTGFDLQKNSLTSAKVMFDQLYAGLVEFDPELNVVPFLADSWDISDDGLTYTFHLGPGLKFSNGEDLTAEDVKFTFERLLDPDTGSPWRSYFTAIDAIEATDEATVVFHLSESSGPLLGYFAHQGAGIIPKDYVEGGGDLNGEPVGAGPFMLKEWIPDLHAVMEANPYYYEEGIPYLDGLEFTFESDDNARAAAIRAGQMDFLQQAPMDAFGEIFEADPNLKLIGGNVSDFQQFVLNNDREPLDDWRVRQAIAWALDREAIAEVTMPRYAVALNGWNIPPPHWAYMEEPCFQQDYDKARELLAEAGYSSGFVMHAMAPTGWPTLIRATETIADQLAPLGIDVQIDILELTLYLGARNNRDFDSYLLGFTGLVDPAQFMAFYETGSPLNYSGFSDAQFDALALEGKRTIVRERRREIYIEAQRYLCEQSPEVIVYANRFFDIVRTNVNTDRFHFMYDWSYKTVRYIWLEE